MSATTPPDILAAILAALPGTLRELEQKTGLTRRVTQKYAHRLHDAGRCHTGDWYDSHSGRCAPIFVAGPGHDAPYPAARDKLTKLEIHQRYVARARERGAWAERLRKRRLRAASRKRAAKKQAALWAAPLFAPEPRPYY